MWSQIHELTVRRVRYSRADLGAGYAGKVPTNWRAPLAGDCVTCALCRVLRDWQVKKK